MAETIARLRHVRTSPTKVRPVLKLIAGQDVSAARDTLRLCERGIARDLRKLLDSAIANAEHNDHVPEDELVVARAFADEGPTLKRWRPRARGRGVRIRKRSSHITIVVARLDDDALQERRRRETASGVSRGRPARRGAGRVQIAHARDRVLDQHARHADHALLRLGDQVGVAGRLLHDVGGRERAAARAPDQRKDRRQIGALGAPHADLRPAQRPG